MESDPYHILQTVCRQIIPNAGGCYDYPNYFDPESDQCVETCPSGTIGVVNGSVNDVTTDRARAYVPSEWFVVLLVYL